MSYVKHAVIAAAGLGSRLGMGRPKCLIEIGGMTILERQLNLLDDIEDVRVVVGFEESHVIDLVRKVRPDTLIVRNPGYRSNTTLHSYTFGAMYLDAPCLFLDGDILFEQASLTGFIDSCTQDHALVGITQTKTRDAVFVHLDDKQQITSFSRTKASLYEWANIVWIHSKQFKEPSGFVYDRLTDYLPLQAKSIICNEIDTKEDMEVAKQNISQYILQARN
ncbi:MAG: hypothetical protein RI993_834 [Pseudomonadota bacterium]